MQIKNGINVVASDGEKVGEVDRLVINPDGGEASHLVVRKGFLFPVDRVIPLDMIVSQDNEELRLNISSDRLEDLPEFIETNFLPLDDQDAARYGYSEDAARPLYYYPMIGAAPLHWGVYPAAVNEAALGYRTVEEKNIPDGSVALKEGAKVLDSEGEHIGDIERVMLHNKDDQVTHLVITKGMINREKKLIPANWIKRIRDDAVQLCVESRLVDRLKDFEEQE